MGKWELLSPIGHGSLATVYQAKPLDSPVEVPPSYAVKLLKSQWNDTPSALEILRREAVLGRSISHPNIVPVLDSHVSEAPFYTVMPYLAGDTLGNYLEAGRCYSLPVTLWFARQTATALHHMHSAGWIHQDIKPGNIHLNDQGHITLLDLGFARRAHEGGSVVDRCITGTVRYIAPEMITSSLRADFRSDIYSLGILLYELLSGEPPFVAGDLVDLARQHCEQQPKPLREIAPQVPQDVAELVHEMIAKQPLRRPESAAEVVQRLAKLEILHFDHRAL